MATSTPHTIMLGCDPQVRVVIYEDEGNLAFQIYAEDPANTDIDALLFNLTDDSVAASLTVYPEVDTLPLTAFDIGLGRMNQIDNGAQVQDLYDVRVEFGQLLYTSKGDVDSAGFTVYLDGDRPLTIDDIDLTNMTAVINSDHGNGLALTVAKGPGDTDAVYETISQTAMHADFDRIQDPQQAAGILSDDGWQANHGTLLTHGGAKGTLLLDEFATDGPVSLSLDANAIGLQNFEASGQYADSLRIEVQIDGGDWALLDEFRVNDAHTALVGSNTGQTIGCQSGTLSYSGGLLDSAQDSVQFRIVSDISAWDEQIRIDNLDVTTTQEVLVTEGPDLVETVALTEGFEGIWDPAQSANVVRDDGWAIRHGAAMTNGCNDGVLKLAAVAADGPVEMSLDMKAGGLCNFENSGWAADFVRIEARVDGGDWQLLDEFRVNDDHTAMVGSETGQTFGDGFGTVNYSGGVLDTAQDSVQFRLVSDITAWDERVFVDNIEIRTFEEVYADGGPVTETFDDAGTGDVADAQFEGFTVEGQRAGDADTSQNDAMVFDTNAPTGEDWDLHYSNQGKALILSEDNDGSDPDDNAHGGTFSFHFTEPSTVFSLDVLDIEEAGGEIDLFDAEGGLIKTVSIPTGCNNGAQTVDIDAQGVSTMDVHLAGSGAIDNLTYMPTPEPDENLLCGQYAVTYDEGAMALQIAELDGEEEDLLEEPMGA